MHAERQLRLSPYTVPELSIGRAPLTPQNSQYDLRRLQYLEGMVTYLNGLAMDASRYGTRVPGAVRIRELLQRLPYPELVMVDPGRDPPVMEHPSARDRIAFDHDRLKVLFLDGLHRGSMSPAIPAGRHSAVVARLVSLLARGISETQMDSALARSEVDLGGAVASLRELGLIEVVDPASPAMPAALKAGKDDRLTWLGHACVLLQTARSAICVDPFLRPHIRWQKAELESAFSTDFGESLCFEPYGPDAPQFSPAQLPPLDAVFITHQDIDHCNLGVLMTLPEETPIVVPDWQPDHPWEVDLAGLIRSVLGGSRRVIRLKHGETLRFGDVAASAFPFHSEMPSSLKTRWNCYLFETSDGAVACTADSAVTDDCVDFLICRIGRRKPLVLCSRPVHSGAASPGYRDESEVLYNFTRLWAWYTPVWDLFHPVEPPGISKPRLNRLALGTDLRAFLPYAMGTAPWYRIQDTDDPLHVPLGNLSVDDLRGISGVLKSMPNALHLFRGKFAEPIRLDAA